MVDVLRRRRAQRLGQLAVQLLVRPVVVAADDVRDPELDVVDHARQLVGRRAVGPQQRDPLEQDRAGLVGLSNSLLQGLGGGSIEVLARALVDRALVRRDAEPLEVAQDLFLPAGDVAGGIRVVDAQEHPVAEIAVGDGAQGVPDMQRPGRGWAKRTLFIGASLEVERVPDVERVGRERTTRVRPFSCQARRS